MKNLYFEELLSHRCSSRASGLPTGMFPLQLHSSCLRVTWRLCPSVCECPDSPLFLQIQNFSIECSNSRASTIFTQCNAVNIIIQWFIFFPYFVFVQKQCVKISEENVSFLILWFMVFKSQFLPVQLWFFLPRPFFLLL